MFSAHKVTVVVRGARRGGKWALLCAALIALAGCGGEPPRVPVVPVRGQVTVDGQPAAGAFVVFHPLLESAPDAAPARAYVKDDGTFELTTYETADGAAPGDYVVTVEWRKLVEAEGDFVPGPNELPAAYARRDSSQLHVKVADAGPNELEPIRLRR